MIITGKILYKGEIVDAGIEFTPESEGGNGKIVRINKRLKGKKVKGLILPAAIDLHVHFRDFKESHKETIESGSLSAIHGGVCLVVDQPNCNPVVDNTKTYFERMNKAEKKIYCDYTLNVALTENNVDSIKNVVNEIREKYYLPAIGEVFLEHDFLQVNYDILSKCVKLNVALISVHAEDPKYIKCKNKEIPNFSCRDEKAEIEAVKKCLKIGRFHFCHISTKDAALDIFNSNSSCEVTPHHTLFSIEDGKKLGKFVNVNPPLRKEKMIEYLNYFDVISSDHAPHTQEEKLNGLSGFPGVETMYPIMVSMIKEGRIGTGVIDMLSSKPAKLFGFDKFGYGEIKEGNYANFAIFDFSKDCIISSKKLHSLCGWTPYEGFKAIFPYKVYLRGELAIDDFKNIGAYGRTIKVE